MTETTAAAINADTSTQPTDYKFNFKTDKEGNKRDSIEAKLPVPTVAGLIAIIETGGKELELLLDVAATTITNQARSVLSEPEYAEITTENFAEKFPFEQISWSAISKLEPRARGGAATIPQEVWEAFAEDFEAIMPAATNKKPEHMALVAKVLSTKFAGKFAYDKPLIAKLKDLLGVYISTTEKAEDFAEAVGYLIARADKLLAREEVNLADVL